MVQQAWSFKAIVKEDLRYWGNDGYHDDSSVFYRYNNSVPNYKNVKEGDIVIIRDREKILGVSIIEKLESHSTTKTVFKCPHEGCDAKKIRPRETIKPKWRCDNGHEFAEQKIVLEPAKEFIANYGSSFQMLEDVSLLQLKSESPRYNIQLSIQEVNIQWAQELLGTQASSIIPLTAGEADNDTPELLEGDLRKIVDRQIKQRRGQKTFRDNLISVNPVCAFTGCKVLDVLEAAHIDAYRNISHNHISNGLLLRCDIHTLFDLNLISINPYSQEIHLSPTLINSEYSHLQGQQAIIKHTISHSALKKRWDVFIKQHNQ